MNYLVGFFCGENRVFERRPAGSFSVFSPKPWFASGQSASRQFSRNYDSMVITGNRYIPSVVLRKTRGSAAFYEENGVGEGT
ncbi:hypothetical protein ACE6ED_15635 [Paenibacillus sp. CN-4]|uniref:hypothetical protein n=1 Tax=Paenibacillus nanchangensis TaxID=3348343 RepID=UPI003978CCB8